MITSKAWDDWGKLATGDMWDPTVVANPQAAARALADWAADILTVLRAVSAELPAVGDSAEGSLFWHTERLYAGLLPFVTGGTASTDLTPDQLATWPRHAAANRDAALHSLADEFGFVLYVLNAVSGADSLHKLASSSEGMPYRHAEKAHVAVLTLLTGSRDDALAVHDLWSGNQEDTAHNLEVLTERKRAESVVVTVAADGNTATFAMPDGGQQDGGRMGDPSGVLWGTDEGGDVVAHGSSWPEVATKLAEYAGWGADTPVIVEYAADQATASD